MTTYIPPRPLTAAEFRAWRKRVGLSQQQVADLFDRSLSTILNWESGRSRGKGAQSIDIPGEVGFACTALYHGLPSWAGYDPPSVIPPKPKRSPPPSAGRGFGSPQADD